jgi:S-disulfanyl-L-cysteine oxidoreductase SoxD
VKTPGTHTVWHGSVIFLSALSLTLAIEASAQGGTQPQAAQAPAGGRKTVWDGIFSEEQAKRGDELYQKSCSLCHRNDLTGTTSDGPPLKGLDFFIRWRGQTLAEMLDAIREIMPANNPGALPSQTYLDIMTFLMKSNGIPAGTTDLVYSPDTLQTILFTEKP